MSRNLRENMWGKYPLTLSAMVNGSGLAVFGTLMDSVAMYFPYTFSKTFAVTSSE